MNLSTLTSKKPAGDAGSLQSDGGRQHRHSSKPVEFLVVVRGPMQNVAAVYRQQGDAFRAARKLRDAGLDAEVKVAGQPIQLEFIF
jgi:hypothetical protein